MPKILVTGGAGFIGSHLVDRLIKAEYEVTVLDNFFNGKIENLQEHLNSRQLTLISGDVRKSSDIKKAINGTSTVFHLAAIVDVPLSIKNPKLTREVNVNGTVNVLEASLAENVAKFILISTCAVYGDAQYLPIDEKHPITPLSPYATTKFEAENHCRTYSSTYGLETCCLRLFNVYGPRQGLGPYSGVITKFIENLMKSKPPIIYGDGKQTRDFINVNDIIGACLLAMEELHEKSETFNIGTGKPTSINELANILVKLSGKIGLKPIYENKREGDIINSYANINRARKMLYFKPEVELEEGLQSLVKYKFNSKL